MWVFTRVIPLAPAGLARYRAGDLLSRVTGDVDALDLLYLRLFTPALAAGAALVAVSILLAVTAPLALPAVIAVFVVFAAILPWRAAEASRSAGEDLIEAAADTRAEAGDLAAGRVELLAYGAGGRVLARLDAASARWTAAQRRLARLSLINAAFTGLSGPLAFAGATTSSKGRDSAQSLRDKVSTATVPLPRAAVFQRRKAPLIEA